MSSETDDDARPRPPAPQRGADGADFVGAALGHLRGGLSADRGASGTPAVARQKEDLRRWAAGLGLLLSLADLPPKVVRGGQEHDLFHDKNVVRAGGVLVPFDVIPCHPAGGFLAFIEDTLKVGHTLGAVRTVTTPGGAR